MGRTIHKVLNVNMAFVCFLFVYKSVDWAGLGSVFNFSEFLILC